MLSHQVGAEYFWEVFKTIWNEIIIQMTQHDNNTIIIPMIFSWISYNYPIIPVVFVQFQFELFVGQVTCCCDPSKKHMKGLLPYCPTIEDV